MTCTETTETTTLADAGVLASLGSQEAIRNLSRLLEQAKPQLVDVIRARTAWLFWRRIHGYSSYQPILTPPTANQKYGKSKRPTYGVSLAPAKSSGYNACTFSTDDCEFGCVAHAGNGRYETVPRARIMKTRFLAVYPSEFLTLVADEISQAIKRHAKRGQRIAVRLNTFSDLRWEIIAPWLFTMFPRVTFYDYTKWTRRDVPRNYHLTFSVSERDDDAHALKMLDRFGTVAVIFDTRRGRPLPATFLGAPVIDGDKSDERYIDKRGVVVGLRAKGKMIGTGLAMVRPGIAS
jgi:hypothetical protein